VVVCRFAERVCSVVPAVGGGEAVITLKQKTGVMYSRLARLADSNMNLAKVVVASCFLPPHSLHAPLRGLHHG